MKKLIILITLAFTTLGYSQAEFEKIALKENTASSSTNKINTQEGNGEVNYIDAANLPVSTATTNALELETTVSAGAVSGFEITNNGNGTVNISSGIAYLRATNDPYATIIKYPISAVTNLALTDEANNFVLVDYNGGTPAITVTTNSSTINTQTNSLAYVISRVGNNLDYLPLIGQNVDPNAKIRIRFLNQEGIRRASGAVLGISNRNITLTSSVLFSGLIRINAAAFNTSSPDTFTLVYNNGSTWTRTTGQTQVNNTQYNVSGTLTTMPNNTFRTDYVYLLPNNPSKLYVVLGTQTYGTLDLAKTAPRPSSLPVELQVLGLEVGRLFIEKNSGSIAGVQSSFDEEFQGTTVSDHNSLSNLQGGASDEYIHLTNAQVTLVNGAEQAANKATDFTTVNNTLYPTVQATKTYTDSKITQTITDGVTTSSPSENAVFDALNSVVINETTGNFSNIQTLIDNNPIGTVISLKANTIYEQDNSLILKQGNTILGNGATLKRAEEQTTTTTVAATEISTSITVSGVPVGWKTGDYLQLYTNDTYLTSSRKYEVIISSIAGNLITLSQPIGAPANGTTYTWEIGTTVRKVFSQITSVRSYDLFTSPTNWIVNNLIIDGNYTQNTGNYYWGVNMAVQNNGKSELHNVTFKDIPNECIFGSGFTIKNSTLINSNGSFLHQSADVTVGNTIFGGEITGNTTINTNIKDGVNVTGHSEAVITFSFSSGRTKITNNRFLGGTGAVMGTISYSITAIDGSLKDFIFSNNYCEGYSSIVNNFVYSASGILENVDNVSISNNTFNNCGVNDFGIYATQINSFGKIKIYDNILNGTTTILNAPWKLSFNDKIESLFSTQGTTSSPVYDKIAVGGIKNSNEAGIYFGNSFGENDGTYIKLSTNPTGASSSPNNAVIINPAGVVNFEQIPTAPTATAGTNTTQIATTAYVDNVLNSGTHTATITNQTNCSGTSQSSYTYTKIGDIVTCRFSGSTAPTAASTPTSFEITLPYSRATSNGTRFGSGTWQTPSTGEIGEVAVWGTSTTTVRIWFKSNSLNSPNVVGQFQYSVIE